MSGSGGDYLAGRTALVTGGARRLGRCICTCLAARGAGVVVHYRSSAGAADELVDAVRSAGGSAWAVQGDLARSGDVAGMFRSATDAAGPIDILVNNASIFDASALDDVTPEALHRNMDVHLVAPLLLTRLVAQQGCDAAVVNMLDTRVFDSDRDHVAYHFSKRALYTLTRMCALELAPGLRVNGVAPGLILPPEGKGAEYLEELKHTNPLNARGYEEDITRAVEFLLASPFITGQVICVDGGRHLKGNVYG